MLIFAGKGALANLAEGIAQVTPDNITPDTTLGIESSQIQPLNPQVDKIDGGAIRGVNLFHSFTEFNIGEGRGAYFTNPAGIENIINRVTGRNSSQIFGILGVSGNANLFLINPNGIVFGANAKLDVNGSFVASTASGIIFADGITFSAVNPQAPPLLTIKIPIGLQFEDIPGAISLQNARLQMLPGKNLALVGGNVSLDGATIIASGGRVELGGLQKAGIVAIEPNGSFQYPLGIQRGDVSLNDGSEVNVRATRGGDIIVNTRNLNILGDSRFRAGIASGLGSVNSKAGNIDVDATGEITISGGDSFISNSVMANARGKAGDINIQAGSLIVDRGGSVFAATYGEGDVGNVNINVSDRILFDGVSDSGFNSGAFNRVETNGTGKAGNLNIVAKSLTVTNGAQLEASTYGKGDAGNINVRSDTVIFDGDAPDLRKVQSFIFSSGAYSRAEPGSVGNSGNINIVATTLKATNGGLITTSTDAKGNAGNVNIKAHDIVFDGEGKYNSTPGFGFSASSGAYSNVRRRGQGNSKGITINTNTLTLGRGAVVHVTTRGQGDGGDILINAVDTVTLAGYGVHGYSSGLYSNTEPASTGKGGVITVNTGNLKIQDGAVINVITENAYNGGTVNVNAANLEIATGGQIVTATRNQGNAGDIKLNLSNQVTLSGSDPIFNQRALGILKLGVDIITNQGAASGLLASTDTKATGNGGNIYVTTPNLFIKDKSSISVSSQGSGIAGNIQVSANNISLQNEGAIAAETRSANGGNIQLQVQDLLLMRQNSLISTTAGTGQAPGNGGNIKVDARNGFIVAVSQENNDIIANAFEGKGGFIDINTFGVFGFTKNAQLTPKSDITAFSQTNPLLNGVIEINTLEIDPTQGLMNLPSVPRSVGISEGCQASSINGENVRFVNRGHGGVVSRPEEPLNPEIFIAGWVDLDGENKLNSNLLDESFMQRELAERFIFPASYPTETLKVSGRRKDVESKNQNCQGR
ncbi:S-layer family protein [Calothrix sp. UHCC 0171]|uniref:S-layer family protein n=1 Tax=Calothrix sp. UHCC 0171 TaxID=3110245 RepID=UPI002B21D602|nr:S-layer family protein [Calothrix sp. UHCC 0171]MEA5573020.1 S-layer family protein [Calothrix sp. UHCC 0171]